jgi:chromosomal replication initiator protein
MKQGQQMLQNVLDTVREQMRKELGNAAFQNWLKPMDVHAMENNTLVLCLPNQCMRDWVVNRYANRIYALWSKEDTSVRSIEYIVRPTAPPAQPPAAQANGHAIQVVPPGFANGGETYPSPYHAENETKGGYANNGYAANITKPAQPQQGGRQAAYAQPIQTNDNSLQATSAQLDRKYRFENFVVGKPNEFAFHAAKRMANLATVPFNPLFLYGGVGLGKTHLMHAIAWDVQECNPNSRVLYLSAEKFMYSFVKALRHQDTFSFKEQFRSVDLLMIDDVQFISGKDSTQEEFFHTFNALVDQGRHIVLSADKSPTDLENIGDRLRSRLASGLVADIHPTTFELRLGILDAKLEQMGTSVPQKVKEFLAHRINTNARELEGALTRIVAHSELVGREITLESAQETLRDLLRMYDRKISMDDIQRKVAEHFKIKVSDMASARRARAVARPRQVAMYLCKQLTDHSLPEIGRAFGGRDHTTVMHAVKKVNELLDKEQPFAEDVDLLRRMLES